MFHDLNMALTHIDNTRTSYLTIVCIHIWILIMIYLIYYNVHSIKNLKGSEISIEYSNKNNKF